jgi:hypothetical protein
MRYRLPQTSKIGSSNMMVAPARMLSAMPVKTDREPNVTTKLGIFPNTMIEPLNAPSNPPSSAPNGSTSSPGLLSGMCLRPATVTVATKSTFAPTATGEAATLLIASLGASFCDPHRGSEVSPGEECRRRQRKD